MKQKIIYQLLFIILLTGILIMRHPATVAQEIRVNATLDTSMLMIGDQTILTLEAVVPPSCRVVWPEIADTLTRQIEVIRKSRIDTLEQDGLKGDRLLTQKLVITSFDSGYFAIPPFVFLYQQPGAAEYKARQTEALLLTVDNPDIDPGADIKDIKGPLKAPVTFAEIWPWLLAALLLAGAVFLVFWYLKKRKKAQPLVTFRRKPLQPAHIIALDELEKLRAKKLWQAGKIKQYHTELTEIVRNYISAKFHVHAIEMVTPDILEALEEKPVDTATRSKLKAMLELADLVKFAKENPLPDNQERSMNQAVDFVKETIHAVEELQQPAEEEITSQ